MKWIISLILFLIFSCTSSRITSSWKAENVTAKKYNKILVLGLIRDADRSIQEKMEQHIVGDLTDLGYNSLSALKVYGPRAFEQLNEETALDKIKNSGVDAVITIVMLDKTKERKYIPGNIWYSPYGYYYNRFWGYYGTMYHRIYEPGYYITDTRYFWESNLYDMSDHQSLVFSAQTESFDPTSSDALADEYGHLLINEMLKNNVIKKMNELPGKAF